MTNNIDENINGILIIGNKKYNNINLNNIIDSFIKNIRFNFGLPNFNNGTKYDILILNNHISKYKNKSLQEKINNYHQRCNISNEYITLFHNNLNKFNKIICQSDTWKSFDWKSFNIFLKKIKCPYVFNKLPRIGFIKIMELIKDNKKSYIFGFSINNIFDEHLYSNNNRKQWMKKSTHNWDQEVKILIWLHNHNYVDATLCILEDVSIITFNCKLIKPSIEILNKLLEYYNSIILKNCINDNITNIRKHFENVTINNDHILIEK